MSLLLITGLLVLSPTATSTPAVEFHAESVTVALGPMQETADGQGQDSEPADPVPDDDAGSEHEEGEHHEVATWVTVLFGFLLAAMIVALAFEEKIHARKSLIVGTFAGLCLLLGTLINLMSFGKVHLPDGHNIDLPVYIPAIDWGVITIILGASLFVEVTSRSGVFSWLAIMLTRRSGGDPWWLLVYYGILTVLFSAVLNNVTAMIIIGSLTTVSLKKLSRTDLLLGFLITEGLLTNVGGLLTLISSVPNIIVGKAADISFAKFFVVAAPYVVVATAVTLLMAKKIFGIAGLKTDEDKAKARQLVDSFDAAESVPSKRFFWFSVGALVLFIGCLAGQAYLPLVDELGMGFVALFFAGCVLWAYRHEVDRFYAAMDWDLLAFFAALFVVINVMEHAQVLAVLGDGIAAMLSLEHVNSPLLLVSSSVASSVTDNIPLAAMLAQILGSPELATASDSPFWWCVIFGANLGGNITPIGSASTVVAMTIIQRQKLGLTFVGFVKAAVPFAVVQLLLAVIYVMIFL